ncbi:CusF family cation efflux system protein [Buttiauxella ferragutiae ATCC 51602]|uniref:CusF family cation efflux system protein n=1 Tax=Buttiauxella ferragutiae ATCC 51602 TaxID=1354252 RepID=A0ABX2W7A3_9ENTR|nr:cation efflux system protein CusF [Buttiauxella ferragutiae]OAT26797.1 CusF family cation efflux system protein [Buttiauxella ferragutiae ATCC 51602]
MRSIKIALFGIFSVAMVAGVQAAESPKSDAVATITAAQQQVITAKGIIKDIDVENKKITIAHEAIPAVSWPAMTMRFTFSELDANIKSLNAGDNVNFSFIQQGNISLLQEIKAN